MKDENNSHSEVKNSLLQEENIPLKGVDSNNYFCENDIKNKESDKHEKLK